MTFSFTFECDRCHQKGSTHQFEMWVPGTLDDWWNDVHSEVRKRHQRMSAGCRGTLYTRMTKHYGKPSQCLINQYYAGS